MKSSGQSTSHLVALPRSDWHLWRQVCLRSSGFPTSLVDELAAPRTAAALDRWLEKKDALARAGEAALAAAPAEERRALKKTIEALKAGRGAHEGALGALASEAARAFAEVQTSFGAEILEVRARLCAIARNEQFREAVLWQNRQAVHTGLDVLLHRPADARDSKTRQKEQLVAKYAQRYSTKCDTIGFFGPHGWAMIDPALRDLSSKPGDRISTLTAVRYEDWAVMSVGEALAARPELAPWIRPGSIAHNRIVGTTMYSPRSRGPIELEPDAVRALRACDGTRTAREIAAELIGDPALPHRTEESVIQLLKGLASKGFIAWRIATPTLRPAPETALHDWLKTIDDPAVHAAVQQELDALESARSEIVASAGDVARLDRALASLDEQFTRITGQAAERFKGETYASRTLLYPTYVRDGEVAIGAEILDALAAPLTLVLESCRWFTYEMTRRVHQTAQRLFREMKTSSAPIELIWFMSQLDREYPLHRAPNNSEGFRAEVINGLHERWSRVLRIPDGARRVERTSSELAAAFSEAFSAPGPGFPDCRLISPDIMIAAKGGLPALQRGEYQLVLGELHPANTLENPFFRDAHPHPEQLLAALEADHDRPRVSPTRRTQKIIHIRILPLLERDYDVAVEEEVSWRPRSQIVRIADLVVDEGPEGIQVRHRDGRVAWDVIQFFSEYLMASIAGSYSILASARHTPRITVDRLVIVRESWTFAKEELAFARVDSELERWAAVRRFAKDAGLPRRVFVRAPQELKPMFVDFDSPVLIDAFCNLVRRATEVSISEMVPDLDEAWLEDGSGRRYVSELRMVALDPRKWTPFEMQRS